MDPSALVKKLDSILNKFMPEDRVAYKRTITRTGGDPLLGRPGTVTHSDTELEPQPLYMRSGRRTVIGDHKVFESAVVGTKSKTLDEYTCLLSPTAMDEDEIQNKDVQLVLKSSTGEEEVFTIDDYEVTAVASKSVMFVCHLRSVKRT